MSQEHERKEWMRNYGIPFDDDGFPEAKPGPAARGQCDRCKVMCERPCESSMFRNGEDREVKLCVDCFRLSMTNTPEFFREGWE